MTSAGGEGRVLGTGGSSLGERARLLLDYLGQEGLWPPCRGPHFLRPHPAPATTTRGNRRDLRGMWKIDMYMYIFDSVTD